VIGYDKLKRNFKQYKDRRSLLKDYDGFLADIRIYKMLPECLGKEFYEKKKFPCPIKLHGFQKPKDLEEQLNSAAKATYYTMGNGPNYSVKVGRMSQDAKDIALNSQQALSQALSYTLAHDNINFDKVVSISMKMSGSPELPIFNQLSEQDIEAFTA